jgi:fatty-acyl-CoA synthase
VSKDFLQAHPDVDQAFVLAEAELRAFCRGKIASYKIPKVVRFVTDVPRTPGPHGDKVQRGQLRAQAIAELGR